MKDKMKVFDTLKARKVLERVNKFLGILIRENLVKDAPFLEEGELENESDLADDVWEVLQMKPRNCDVGTPDEQAKRHGEFCDDHFTPNRVGGHCRKCPLEEERGRRCPFFWMQMPYEDGGAK